MIQYYKHSEIDKERWNQCVTSALHRFFFCDYDLLTIANPEWGALVEDDYRAVMPLPWRSRFGTRYIYSPFFLMRLGILSPSPITAEKAAQFVRAIPATFVQTELVLNEGVPANSLPSSCSEMVTHTLPLNRNYEQLRADFSSNHKRNIQSARKHNLSVETEIPIQYIITLFRNNRGQDRHIKIREADYILFQKMCDYASSRNMLDSWGARDADGNIIAAALFLHDGNKRYFWFSGRNEQHANKKAMFFLIDEYIRTHANEDAEIDFCGSKNENVARFYSGFGAIRHTYPMLRQRNALLTPLIRLYKLFR